MSTWKQFVNLTWKDLLQLPNEELAQIDVALCNLVCAAGLPDSGKIDVGLCLRTLDDWAKKVRWGTQRQWHLFEKNPGRYFHSRNYFRILAMITILQRDLGVRYNPAKIPEDVPFETEDSFIHGVIQGDGGTCGSMPVIYAAVGRRLGYPLKLVLAKRHLFARWDDPPDGERFNIEGAGKGLNCYSDDHYRRGLYEITPKQEAAHGYLHSLTPRQELAGFLHQRACHWAKVGKYREAVEALAWMASLTPEIPAHACWLVQAMDDWGKDLEERVPVDFPRVVLPTPPRRFPNLPLEADQTIVLWEAVEICLQSVVRLRRQKAPMPVQMSVQLPGPSEPNAAPLVYRRGNHAREKVLFGDRAKSPPPVVWHVGIPFRQPVTVPEKGIAGRE